MQGAAASSVGILAVAAPAAAGRAAEAERLMLQDAASAVDSWS
jgi:hypothetical protein